MMFGATSTEGTPSMERYRGMSMKSGLTGGSKWTYSNNQETYSIAYMEHTVELA